MNLQRVLIAAFATLINMPGQADGQATGDTATIRHLEDMRRIAYAEFDTVRLAPLLAIDYRVVAPGTARPQGRGAALRVIKMTQATHVPIRAIRWDTLDVRILGDVAITRGRLTHIMAPRDGSADWKWTDNFLHVWVRREGRWQLLERHGFKEPEP
jgi:hypothetical protein